MSNDLWLAKIFEKEFAFSDIRSNYSRAYAWMANQLGHMALGLSVALLFYWFDDTFRASFEVWPEQGVTFAVAAGVTAAVILWLYAKSRRPPPDDSKTDESKNESEDNESEADNCSTDRAKPSYGILIAVAAGVVVLPFVGLLLIRGTGLAESGSVIATVLLGACFSVMLLGSGIGVVMLIELTKPLSEEQRNNVRPFFLPAERRHKTLLVALLLIFGLLVAIWSDWQAEIMSLLITSLLFAGIVICLAKELRFALLAGLAVLGGFLLGSGLLAIPEGACAGAPLCFAREAWIAAAIGLAYVGLATKLLCFLKREGASRYDRWFYFVVALTFGYWFFHFVWVNPDPAWRVPVAAGVASMSLWLVKEFGNDLPNVYRELLDAERERQEAGAKPLSLVNDQLRASYIDTTFWDIRMDCFFCVAGAIIAIAVLSDGALLAQGAWTAGADILGLLLFVVIFIAGGRNWAYRQQALDLTGVMRANMLAVIQDCVGLQIHDVKTPQSPRPCPGDPRQALYDFARGKRSEFGHILVFGEGRMNERLADALVSEAALRDLPPMAFARLRPAEDWRLARKISYGRMLDYDPENLMVAELPHNAIWNLGFNSCDENLKLDLRRVAPLEDPSSNAAFRAADLVAVTRCKAADFAKAVNKLDGHSKQSSAWFFNHGPPDDKTLTGLIQILSAHLKEKSRSDHVAVVTLKNKSAA